MRIPEDKIEEIRSSADIVDVISGYVQLRKRGKNYIGLCPFHQEKTSSFVVSPDKQIYHCFGCHAGGNVFKFLMEYKNISFIESVQELAGELGIEINYENQSADDARNAGLEQLYDINTKTARHFVDNLKNTEDGKKALEYLKNREVDKDMITKFGIGYAMFDSQVLVNFCRKNGFEFDKAKELGVIDSKDGKSFYGKFRDRVIFPIFSTNGRVIAFGGRILDKESQQVKYLNSPESRVYSKRKVLYGLFHAKDEIRKNDVAILVEGYMDVIALYKFGVKNVVASSGTALTDEQVTLLSRFTRNIVVLFDSDNAGQNAASRSIEILLKQDFEIKILTLPAGDDPDSFINKHGKDKFLERIKQAVSFLEYQTGKFEADGSLEDPSRSAEAIREIVKTIALVNDELKRQFMIKSLSKKFKLRVDLLENELVKHLNNQPRTTEQRSKPLKTESDEETSKVKIDKTSLVFEKEIVRLLFSGNDRVIGFILDHIMPEDFTHPKFQELATMVQDNYMKDIVSPASLIEQIDDAAVKNFIIELSIKDHSISEKRWDEVVQEEKIKSDLFQFTVDLIKNHELKKLDVLIKENNKLISNTTDEAEIIELFKHNNELMEERKKIINENYFNN